MCPRSAQNKKNSSCIWIEEEEDAQLLKFLKIKVLQKKAW
jgi:hypothetical protein